MDQALNTPVIKPKMWIPTEPTPVALPQHTGQQRQEHRAMTWLHHKPQSHAIFPMPPQSGRK